MNKEELAEAIARRIFYHNIDNLYRRELENLLKMFAEEILRESIEP